MISFTYINYGASVEVCLTIVTFRDFFCACCIGFSVCTGAFPLFILWLCRLCYICLFIVNISKNQFYSGETFHPDRLPSRQHDATVSLRLFDTRDDTIENVQKLSGSLKRLLVSGIHLKTVPESLIDQLTHLEKLTYIWKDVCDFVVIYH
jgi:hypothetical protein